MYPRQEQLPVAYSATYNKYWNPGAENPEYDSVMPVAGGVLPNYTCRVLEGSPFKEYQKFKMLKIIPTIVFVAVFAGIIPFQILHFDRIFHPVCIDKGNLSYWNIPDRTYFEAREICWRNFGDGLLNSTTFLEGDLYTFRKVQCVKPNKYLLADFLACWTK